MLRTIVDCWERGDMYMGARADLGCLRQTEEGFGFADEWIGGRVLGNMSLCGIVRFVRPPIINPENDKRREALREKQCGLSG